MKKILPLLVAIQITVFFVGTSISDPWRPQTSFQPIAREKIFKNAKEMVEFSWSPLNNIRNFAYKKANGKNVYTDYYNGTVYYGEAYSMISNVYDWAGFYEAVNNAPPTNWPPNVQDVSYWGNVIHCF